MTTGKTIALTIWTFVGKAMPLLFNMLSRFVIVFLSRSKRLLISWLQSPSAVVLEPKKIKSVIVSIVSLSICHVVMGPHAGRADYKCKASVMRTYLMSLRNSMGGPVWLELSWDQMGSGTWDCLPQQCNACTWTHISWSKQQNMKKLYGAKNKCVHAQLGQIMNKRI